MSSLEFASSSSGKELEYPIIISYNRYASPSFRDRYI